MGKKVATAGTATRKTTWKQSATTKGITPRYMSLVGIPTTPLRANRLIPKGGVIKPISAIRHIITPYQIGSNPNFIIKGKRIGKLRIKRAIISKKQPIMI